MWMKSKGLIFQLEGIIEEAECGKISTLGWEEGEAAGSNRFDIKRSNDS